MIVDEFLLYDQYLDVNQFSYAHIVRGANEEMCLTEEERQEVIQRSKKILKDKHGIELVQDDPIRVKRNRIRP